MMEGGTELMMEGKSRRTSEKGRGGGAEEGAGWALQGEMKGVDDRGR